MYQKIIANGDDVAITSITLYETMYGLIKFKKPFYHLSSFRVYGFSKEDALLAAKLDLDWRKMGKSSKERIS